MLAIFKEAGQGREFDYDPKTWLEGTIEECYDEQEEDFNASLQSLRVQVGAELVEASEAGEGEELEEVSSGISRIMNLL